jgi:hypothetical protein
VTPPDETLAWTDAQIEFEIARQLLDDSELVCEWQDCMWAVRIERHVAGEVQLVHSVAHIDRRMALYDVYGLLWLQGQPRPVGPSMWDPTTPRPTAVSVARYVQSILGDPDDLDPKEVAAVYGIAPSQQRRN